MKIALYYPWVYLTSGAERSILELVKRSHHNWTIFTNHFDSEHTYPEFRKLKLVELRKVSVDRSFSKVMAAALRIVLQKLDLENFDALLVVCEGIGDMIVFRNHAKPVFCLCLTPLRPVFDPYYKAAYLNGKGLYAKLKLSLFGTAFTFLDRLSWKYYKHILCISRESYKRVLAGRLAKEEKMGLAFPGIDFSGFHPTGHFQKYFLLPGRIMWTKNIELGIKAFQKFRRDCPVGDQFRLIIAGIVDSKSKVYFSKLRDIVGLGNGIEFVIHPNDQMLFELYDRAYAVLFTPFNEDWGLIPLEAMAYGKTVIAVNSGGPLETIIHGENGFLAEPKPEDFAHYMASLATSPDTARLMGEKGRRHVQRYDWKYFINTIDDMIDNA